MMFIKANTATAAKRRIYGIMVAPGTDTRVTTKDGSTVRKIIDGVDSGSWAATLVHVGAGEYYCELTQAESNVAEGTVLSWGYKDADVAEAVCFSAQIMTSLPSDNATAIANGVPLAANQDIRNVGGTLPAVTLATLQPNYAPAKAGDSMVASNMVVAAPTVTAIRQEIDANSTKLETVAEGIAALGTASDPLATTVPGSDPPITRGEAIDALYIPEYVGPVVTVPAPPSSDFQTLYFSVKEFGANIFSVGDTLTMTLQGNDQSSTSGSILEPVTRTSTIASNGSGSFTADKGAYIKVTASNATKGTYFTKELTVDNRDMADILTY
jgi:hypothetical protein